VPLGQRVEFDTRTELFDRGVGIRLADEHKMQPLFQHRLANRLAGEQVVAQAHGFELGIFGTVRR
jgi:hypothetical protein